MTFLTTGLILLSYFLFLCLSPALGTNPESFLKKVTPFNSILYLLSSKVLYLLLARLDYA